MIRIARGVIVRRKVDPKRLGWIEDRRAGTRLGLPANQAYVDLRGFRRIDLDAVLEEERVGYQNLEAAGYDEAAIEALDRNQAAHSIARILDFGVAAAVVAVSALGCIPITSCRGNSLGRKPHEHPAPMLTFYARRLHLPAILDAAAEADLYVTNNEAKVEVYADDLRKMNRFAAALRKHIKE
jgi:hypothetical protein